MLFMELLPPSINLITSVNFIKSRKGWPELKHILTVRIKQGLTLKIRKNEIPAHCGWTVKTEALNIGCYSKQIYLLEVKTPSTASALTPPP